MVRSQVNKPHGCKIGLKIGGGNDPKHSLLICNSKIYNGIYNAHIYRAILLELKPQTIKKSKRIKFAIANSGCNGNFMALHAQLNYVQPTTKTNNEKCLNGKIIKSKIGGYLDLPMLPNIERQAHIFPNINHSLVYI